MTFLVFFFHATKVATLTQVKAIYTHPYIHICISVSQPVRNIGIVIFAGIVVFTRL